MLPPRFPPRGSRSAPASLTFRRGINACAGARILGALGNPNQLALGGLSPPLCLAVLRVFVPEQLEKRICSFGVGLCSLAELLWHCLLGAERTA